MAKKKAAPKSPPKLVRPERPISFRRIPGINKKTLAGVLNQMEDNAEAINALKRPDENFGFKIYGNKSWRVFESVDGPKQLLEYISKYRVIDENLNKRMSGDDDLLENLVIVRTKKNADIWKPEKQKMTKRGLSDHRARLAESRKKLRAVRKRTNQAAFRKRKKK